MKCWLPRGWASVEAQQTSKESPWMWLRGGSCRGKLFCQTYTFQMYVLHKTRGLPTPFPISPPPPAPFNQEPTAQLLWSPAVLVSACPTIYRNLQAKLIPLLSFCMLPNIDSFQGPPQDYHKSVHAELFGMTLHAEEQTFLL